MLSFDEKGKTPVKHYGGKKWDYKQPRTPYGQKIKGMFDIFAVKNIHTKERHCEFYDWKNQFIVIEFFSSLLAIYHGKEVYIILDGWSAHKSEKIKIFADLTQRLHLVYLPTRSSWMNEIERDFSRVQNEVLDNSDFESAEQSMQTILAFFEKELNLS